MWVPAECGADFSRPFVGASLLTLVGPIYLTLVGAM